MTHWVFYTLAVMIVGLGILVITARSAVHSVLFLVLNFLLIAALYITLNAEFWPLFRSWSMPVGSFVLYLFVVMLVSLKRAPEQHADSRRLGVIGMALALVVLVELVAIAYVSSTRSAGATVARAVQSFPAGVQGGNTEELGWVLYTDYLIPFELASMLLLVAMVGAIVLAKRSL